MHRITVLLAEDHMIVREGLRSLLEIEGKVEVVAEAKDGREAVELVQKLRPAVVLMDIAMPKLNGLEATRQILKAVPGTRVIILSAHNDDAYVDQALAVGAAGYLIKQTSAKILSTAIIEAEKGRTFLCPSISKRVRERSDESPTHAGRAKKRIVELSPRERETLQLIAEGMANKNIAAELGISIKTVEKHRQSVMEKLDIHDTAGLVRHAISAGIIEGGDKIPLS